VDTDIVLFNSGIERVRDRHAIKVLTERKKRKNVLLLLVTEGGDPDAAYRIARCLQDRYKKFSVLVAGYCKSAGTLLALGANELIFSENGELGPLDVQMEKKDELWEQESGLTVQRL
jgi:ClpP class serine protease